MNRADIFESIQKNPNISVLVIGAGINGIGTFRDLALQGVDVLIVDRDDFCSGTSAASSHMLHGGIRYLENGEFRLVREALHERNLMLQNAPHLARPLPTTVPIFRWFSGLLNAPLKFLGLLNRPGERGAAVIKLGLMMYDWFVRGKSPMPSHQVRLAGNSLLQFPKLNPDILATATYYDAFMPSPERICVELIADAEEAGGRALNYVSVVGGEGDNVTLRDEIGGKEYLVKPQIVVNAAGPWIDFVNRSMQQELRFIGGTKGSHIVVDHPELFEATNGNEFFFENEDGRIVLVFPWMGRVMIGTSDLRIENPDEAVCTEEEVDYFIELVKKVFPTIEVNRSHIVFRFCGVRPLPYQDANSTGQISRDHSIRVIEPDSSIRFPVYSLVGGKWTTWRAFAEQAADKILERLGNKRQVSTSDIRIGGGKDYPLSEEAWDAFTNVLVDDTKVSQERAGQLLDRYGTYSLAIATFIAQDDDQPLAHKSDYSRRELMFLAQNEKVIHLDDLLLRRTLMGMRGYVTTDLLLEVADLVAEALGWSEERKDEEIQRVVTIWQERHQVALNVPRRIKETH